MTEPAALIRAAGAIVWRADEVALVHRPGYDDWSFPKGKVKNGEHVLRTVVREVAEETGITPVLGHRLPSTSYLKDGRPKRVDYWTATCASAEPFVPNDEVDQVAWVSIPQALSMLTYERDAELLREFAEGPRATTPVIILRHAPAGEKRFWHGSDLLRPLDARGRFEAAQLPQLLAAYGPSRLISSATARCTETLLPYAVSRGLPLETDPAFTVGSPEIAHARTRFADLCHQSLVVCTHGEIVSDLVTALCSHYDEKPPDDPTLRKSSFWVAHLTPTAITSLERHAPRS